MAVGGDGGGGCLFLIIKLPFCKKLIFLFAKIYHSEFFTEFEEAVDHVPQIWWQRLPLPLLLY